MFDGNGGRPRGHLVPKDLPAFLSGPLVQGDDEGLAFVVPVDDQRLSVQDRRAPFPMAVSGLHHPQLLLPLHFAVRTQAEKTLGPEVRHDSLAVGQR